MSVEPAMKQRRVLPASRCFQTTPAVLAEFLRDLPAPKWTSLEYYGNLRETRPQATLLNFVNSSVITQATDPSRLASQDVKEAVKRAVRQPLPPVSSFKFVCM